MGFHIKKQEKRGPEAPSSQISHREDKEKALTVPHEGPISTSVFIGTSKSIASSIIFAIVNASSPFFTLIATSSCICISGNSPLSYQPQTPE